MSSKGVNLPISCPFCNSEVEDLLHVFFSCLFVVACWRVVDAVYDLSLEVSVSIWLVNKIGIGLIEEVLEIAKVLWEFDFSVKNECGKTRLF